MKLVTGTSLAFDPVTEQQLRDTLADDEGRGEFVILSRDEEVYIQAAGVGAGRFTLEYRDGDAGHHFSAGDAVSNADVLRAFSSYLAGDDRWRAEFSWHKVEFKPWWKFW